MLTQIAEGIHKVAIQFPFGMREVNSYLFEGRKGVTIVDTGSFAEQAIEIWKQVLPAGTPVEKVILTHAHTDHIGLANWLREHYQAPLIIPRRGFEEMRKYRERLQQCSEVESIGYPFFLKHDGPALSEKLILQQVDADYFEPDELLDDEQEIWMGEYPFEAIWTPGHSPDHFCFYNRSNRLLLAGDHVLNEISPLIPIWSEEEGNPLQLYFDSLERVSALPVDLALPGHGSVIHDVTARISQIREGHEQRMQQIVDAIGHEGSTAGQVCQSVYQLPRIGSRNLAEFLMTLTRLLYLEAAGKVSAVERSGKVIFSVES